MNVVLLGEATHVCYSTCVFVPALIISEGDALCGHFEVDDCWRRTRLLGQSALGCLGDSLRASQWFRFHWI